MMRRPPYDRFQGLSNGRYQIPVRDYRLGPLARQQSLIPPPPMQNPKSLDEATVFLINHLDKNQNKVAEMLHRARTHFGRIPLPPSGPALDRVFSLWLKELGKSIFADQVSERNISFMVRPFREGDRPGRTYVPGLRPQQRNLTAIHLGEQVLYGYRREMGQQAFCDKVMAMLIHQMIHAYFIVACGQQRDDKEPDGRLKHGEHFSCIMYKIKELSARGSLLPHLPLGCSNTWVHQGRDITGGFADVGGGRQRWGPFTPYEASDCRGPSADMPEDMVRDWYQNTCAKAADPDVWEFKGLDGPAIAIPQSECGDKKDWVEIVHKEKPYKIDRGCFEKNIIFAQKNFDDGRRELQIPESVDDSTFARMMHFLQYGVYRPEIGLSVNGSAGPPLIQQGTSVWPDLLIDDIKVHKLATSVGFTELRRFALRRLKDQQITYEDPCGILLAIYPHDREPDHELREWAQRFLRRFATPAPGCFPIDSSNWSILNSNYSFRDELAHHPYAALRMDFTLAGDELKAMAATPLQPQPSAPLPDPPYAIPSYNPPIYYNVPPPLRPMPMSPAPSAPSGNFVTVVTPVGGIPYRSVFDHHRNMWVIGDEAYHRERERREWEQRYGYNHDYGMNEYNPFI